MKVSLIHGFCCICLSPTIVSYPRTNNYQQFVIREKCFISTILRASLQRHVVCCVSSISTETFTIDNAYPYRFATHYVIQHTSKRFKIYRTDFKKNLICVLESFKYAKEYQYSNHVKRLLTSVYK